MSFGIIAAGIGAAGSIAGGMMQAGGASDAAATSAGQSQINAAALRAAGQQGDALLSQSGQRADQLLSGSGKKADQLLQAGYKGAVRDMRPYDRLGLQGSNALARYLGFVTEYQGAKPQAPKAPTLASFVKPTTTKTTGKAPDKARDYNFYRGRGENDGTARAKAAADSARYKKELATHKKPSTVTPKATAADKLKHKNAIAAANAKYKTDLAAWQGRKADHTERMRNASGRGAYFDPYTKDDLMADPVYQTELDENVRAWDQSAASRGSLMSGNTVAGLRELTAAGIQRGYDRDWNQDERKYNAYAGLNNMGLGVRTGLAQARMNTAGQRANTGVAVGANRAATGVQVGANRANTLLQGAGAQANYAQQAADASASGRLAQGTAYGNAFGNVGTLGMLYGLGAFKDNKATV